jgi:hypothetical protein
MGAGTVREECREPVGKRLAKQPLVNPKGCARVVDDIGPRHDPVDGEAGINNFVDEGGRGRHILKVMMRVLPEPRLPR